MNRMSIPRREALALGLAAAAAPVLPARAAEQMPRRAIPSSSEMLPVIGLGSSKAVSQLTTDGLGPLTEVLTTLTDFGGSVVDTWPRQADDDRAFGKLIANAKLRDKLFITAKIDRMGKDAGLAQFRETLANYGVERIDLLQIFSLTDLKSHWPTLQEMKGAGKARYIGVTVSTDDQHGALEDFLKREKPDFIQVNYSVTERKAENRILPLTRDRGVAAVINRPFMNGAFFKRLADTPVPEWAVATGSTSWATFSLKYILANPLVTSVLTETTSTKHMAENARAAFGVAPDAATRARMSAFIDQL